MKKIFSYCLILIALFLVNENCDDPTNSKEDKLFISIISHTDTTICMIGDSLLFNAEVKNYKNEIIDDSSYTWHSSNPSVALIDSNSGLCYTKSIGQSRITVTLDDVASDTVDLDVKSIGSYVFSSIITPKDTAVKVGSKIQFFAKVFDNNNSELGDTEIKWFSTNLDVASFEPDGLLNCFAPGETEVFIQVDEYTSESIHIQVKSHEEYVTFISISPDSVFKGIGSSYIYHPQIEDINGEMLENIAVEWISSDTSVATIDKNGTVICKNIGYTEIYARVNDVISNTSTLEIISTSIMAGQTEGKCVLVKEIDWLDFSPVDNNYKLDLNDDNIDDIRFYQFDACGNNCDKGIIVEPLNGSKICYNQYFSEKSDSIFFANVDTTECEGYTNYWNLKFLEYFQIWIEKLDFNSLINEDLDWTQNIGNLKYFYKRDVMCSAYDYFGLFWEEEQYIGIQLNSDKVTSYGWIYLLDEKVKLSACIKLTESEE